MFLICSSINSSSASLVFMQPRPPHLLIIVSRSCNHSPSSPQSIHSFNIHPHQSIIGSNAAEILLQCQPFVFVVIKKLFYFLELLMSTCILGQNLLPTTTINRKRIFCDCCKKLFGFIACHFASKHKERVINLILKWWTVSVYVPEETLHLTMSPWPRFDPCIRQVCVHL